MVSTSLILSNVSKHISLEEQEAAKFITLLNERTLDKNEYLLNAGTPCTGLNYVCDGALRAFYRDENDKEATIMFAIKDWWITDMPAFVSGNPAMISIQAIAKSTVLQL